MLRKFTGTEIATALVEAVEAIPADSTIVTVSAGENMPILIAIDPDNGEDMLPEYSWDGAKLVHIGYL